MFKWLGFRRSWRHLGQYAHTHTHTHTHTYTHTRVHIRTYIFFFFFFSSTTLYEFWLAQLFRSIASFFSCALCFQFFTPIFLRSFLTSSSHLNLGLPFGLAAYGFHLYMVLATLSLDILSTCPNQLNLLLLMCLTIFSYIHIQYVQDIQNYYNTMSVTIAYPGMGNRFFFVLQNIQTKSWADQVAYTVLWINLKHKQLVKKLKWVCS